MRFREMHPLSLTKQFFWGVGIIKDEFRYDIDIPFGEDIDFFLQKANHYRKVLRFNYYSWKRIDQKAGGIPDRSHSKIKKSYDNLINKWGSKIVRYKKEKDLLLAFNSPLKGI